MNLIPGVEATGSALYAEKLRLDVIAQNIANANTTNADGEAYKRKIVSFEEHLGKASDGNQYKGVRVSKISDDETPGHKIYNPHHPDANAEGYVEMPNVELSKEMVDLITASRSYEANLTVVRTARQMTTQALAIGR
tara:strand:+ start:819 stop:1229 length:411 start_codon:yes stop_codon:yes gene_type:complete